MPEVLFRVLVPAAMALDLGLVVVRPIVAARGRPGAAAVSWMQGDRALRMVMRAIDVASVLATVAFVVFAVAPGWPGLVVVPALAAAPGLRLAAIAMALASTAVAVTAQTQMGASWRIGLAPEGAAPPLVTRGLFARSRNPIYTAGLAVVLGLSLATARLVPLLAWAVLAALVRQLVVREEQALARAHGDDYAQYRRRVRRWL